MQKGIGDGARLTWGIAACFDNRPQVFMTVATASANNIDAKLGNELTQCLRHGFRFRRIDRQTVDV